MKQLLLILLTAAPSWSTPTTVSLEPIADTFIRAQEPARNFGTSGKLEVSGVNEQVALFRFDLSQIPASAVVSSVQLKLLFDAPANQPMDSKFVVCDLNRDFQEAEANYQEFARKSPWTAPGLARFADYGSSYFLYCSAPMHIKGPAPAAADVTAYVRMAVDTHRKSVNFALFSTKDSYRGAAVYSRRSTLAANRPKLELTFDPAAPKAVTNPPLLEQNFGPVTLDGSSSTKPDGSKAGLLYLWTVDRPAPASTYSPGQELGHEAQLKFEPDVPGLWNLRLRVTDPSTHASSDAVVSVTDIRFGGHPRLGLDQDLLGQIKSLRDARRTEWVNFEEWLKHPGDPGYGNKGQALLLGYAITKEKSYFDEAWKIYAPSIYNNGLDRAKGLRPFFGACGPALFCDDHAAGFVGGYIIMQIATLYDWGFDALSASQRGDLLDWMNAACDYNHLDNPWSHSHFRNDGMVITAGIAAAAYATYGENHYAPVLMSWFRQEWGHTLEALDVIGRGGALGEGNAYDEAAGAFLIQLANLVYYASGENLFVSHSYFQRHLAYEAFSTYPNRLGEADDPISHSDPPHPYPEGASLNGDDNRGRSWHSIHLRPNGLALVRRFPNSEEAGIWNWVFRQNDVDQPGDAWAELFYYSPPQPIVKPKRLSFFDPSLGYVYIRSDWNSRDATWISSWAGPHADLHQHLDQGSFTVFKRRDLAIKSGNYDISPVQPHFMSYYTRSVSANSILIGDPNEYFDTFIAYWGCDGAREHDLFPAPDGGPKVCIPNDGGQRTMAPYSMTLFDNDTFWTQRDIYDVAQVTSFADNGQAVAWVADITNAYNNPRYTTPHNKPKVTKVYRKFLYLREPDILFVADTVESTSPDFEKSWLIHAVDHIDVAGAVKQLDPGESIHTGTDKARIVVDDRSPSNRGEVTADLRTGYAALQLQTLYPAHFRYDLIGGREAAPTPHPTQGQADPKVLQENHFHRHFKDFWVKDYSEGVHPDHRSQNWAPIYPQEVQDSLKSPTFIGGYGRWRLEVQPAVPSKNDYFLNVLKPTVEPSGDLPPMEKFETADAFGASFTAGGKSYKVSFSKETLAAPTVEGMDLKAPQISNAKPKGTLPAGSRQTTIAVTTDEPASCRFAFRPGTTFPFMTNAFQSGDGLTHTTVNRDLNSGDTYTYFVRCVDKAGNETLDDFRLTFSVAH
jgi:hypothetical protein